jgi:hypothetical protein
MNHDKLPLYRCHKEVRAFRIRTVIRRTDEGAMLFPEGDYGHRGIGVSEEWCRKHDPKAGGYFVRYQDGYESYSPADAFESGYTRVEG